MLLRYKGWPPIVTVDFIQNSDIHRYNQIIQDMLIKFMYNTEEQLWLLTVSLTMDLTIGIYCQVICREGSKEIFKKLQKIYITSTLLGTVLSL